MNFFFSLFQAADGSWLVKIDESVIRIADNMYNVLLHYNQNTLYKTSSFDMKFITLNMAGLFRPQEIRERIEIASDDARIEFIRGENWKFIKLIHSAQ